MKITLLYGATLSEGWGRSQNLAMALCRLGHEVEYLDCIRPLGRGAAAPRDLPAGLHWHRAAPGIPERPWTSSLHALWQGMRLAFLPGGRRDLLLFYGVPHPFVQETACRLLPARRRAYDCADDKVSTFRDLSGEASAKLVGTWERELLSKVDALTAINQANLLRLDPGGRLPGAVVENGVDLELFRFRRRRMVSQGPLKLAYAGTVNDRMDIPRLGRLLEANPEVELHIFGGDHPCLDPLRDHPRLRLRGWIPFRELPEALDGCDIGLVPYRDLPSIRASSPLKSLQYLALGLPVAAFPYPGLPLCDGQVHLLDEDRLPEDVRSWSVPDDGAVREHGWDAVARRLLAAVGA